jgi:hypothetical protein
MVSEKDLDRVVMEIILPAPRAVEGAIGVDMDGRISDRHWPLPDKSRG